MTTPATSDHAEIRATIRTKVEHAATEMGLPEDVVGFVGQIADDTPDHAIWFIVENGLREYVDFEVGMLRKIGVIDARNQVLQPIA